MFCLYILRSKKDRKLYVGQTNNLEERLKRHNSGEVQATRNRRPLVLIHNESYRTRSEAFKREQFLKSLWGGREKKKILKRHLEKVE